MVRRRLGIAAVVVCACACTVELVPRPRPPAPPSRDSSMGLAISTKTLASGLRVVVVRDPTASEVQVTMRYGIGAVDDGATPGIAHLVEHLMFQQVLDGQPVFTQLEDVATYFNAATSFDETTYVARAPAGQLDKLLAIEASRLGDACTTLDDSVFERERQVVVNELQQRDPTTEIYSALYRALYPAGHPMRTPIGGSVESVHAITKQQACAFEESYYAPRNAVLVISGRSTSAEAESSLAKLDARITRRTGVSPSHPEAPRLVAQHLEIPAPIDDDVLVIAWPLPTDPELQIKVRAIAASLPKLVDAEIKGTVSAVEVGDRSVPMFALAVLPGEGETLADVIAGARRGVAGLPKVFQEVDRDHLDEIVFEYVRQSAIYGLYSVLEDGSDRDARLASYVAAGRSPREAIDLELRALGELTRDEAAGIAARYLAANTPTVVTLKASVSKKRGDKVTLRLPIHDLGRRRTPVDPGLAERPVASADPADELHVQSRTLPNGLKVILLPVTAVPTFDARLIFGAGTADEPADQRGVALFAAHTLTWNLRYLEDAFAFLRAGALRSADVGNDATTFTVHGVEANLDLVLTGLRRWVRDGVYDDSAEDFAAAMRRAAKNVDDQGVLTDTWRTALFGAGHPYVAGGLVRHANQAITLDQATGFRDAYYTPDNATLVIAGRFDLAAANRWIDFLFKDWAGNAAGHRVVPIAPQPMTIAKVDDTALVQVKIAIPVRTPQRAQRLVAAEMLADVARDVRFQLGASYSFEGALAETRLASFIVAGGSVDAARATEALQLIVERLAELHRDPVAAARAFVVARTHVATQLRARVGSASALADRVEQNVELSRDPLADLRLADAVDLLTVLDMRNALAELDLAHATVMIDGPQDALNGALAAIGRTPTYVGAAPAPMLGVMAPGLTTNYKYAEQHVMRSELVPALTEQPPQRLMLTLGAFATAASEASDDYLLTGYSLVGQIGYRYGWTNGLALRFDIGRFGRDVLDSSGLPQTRSVVPADGLAVWHLGGPGRGWGEVAAGVHFERDSARSGQWQHAWMYGLQAGWDIIRHRGHRVGVALRWDRTESTSLDYAALSLGITYRQ